MVLDDLGHSYFTEEQPQGDHLDILDKYDKE